MSMTCHKMGHLGEIGVFSGTSTQTPHGEHSGNIQTDGISPNAKRARRKRF